MQRFCSSGLARHFSEVLITLRRWGPRVKKNLGTTTTLLLFLPLLIATAFISSLWNSDTSNFSVHNISRNKTVIIVSRKPQNRPPKRITTPLNCVKNQTQTCPTNYPKTSQTQESISDYSIPPTSTCPDYFRWIHEDLSPWKVTGITRDMLERANQTAHFRLILVNNKVYIHKYKQSIQTRDVFTIWGILQLLRKYPGRLPDLELMFDCDDRPVIRSRDYSGPNNKGPPPLFRYSGDRWTMDIVFPDWSFWGW